MERLLRYRSNPAFWLLGVLVLVAGSTGLLLRQLPAPAPTAPAAGRAPTRLGERGSRPPVPAAPTGARPAGQETVLAATPTPVPPVAPAPATLVSASPTAAPSPGAGEALPRVPVLCYHLINVPSAGIYNVSSAQFAAQMAWLHEQGYQTINPDQLLAAIRTGSALPAHPVLITFDDTQLSAYRYAVPILERYGFQATFFIETGRIGKPGGMSAAQILDLVAKGYTIGGHTHMHPRMPRLTPAQLQAELDRSDAALTSILGSQPRYFAYPFGLYNGRVATAVASAGYVAAFRLDNPADLPVDPAFMIPRQIVSGQWSLATFVKNVHWLEQAGAWTAHGPRATPTAAPRRAKPTPLRSPVLPRR